VVAAERERTDLNAYTERARRGPCFVCGPERTYVYSLGSQQGNAHLHWHIAGLPPGTPYAEQQFHALMAENGVLPVTPGQAADTAVRLRAALTARGIPG
jgi:histidine triad (HIT) family protein/ATP adenylyltransferase